eukprot:9499685-Pyramimonas_sp.AAC.2
MSTPFLVGRRRVEGYRLEGRLGVQRKRFYRSSPCGAAPRRGTPISASPWSRSGPGQASATSSAPGALFEVLGVWGVECTLPVIRTGGPGSGIGAGGLESISELFGYFNQKFSP